MSDDLRQDLTRLAHRAELDAAGSIAPAEAVIRRARRRRRDHRIIGAGMAAVVVAALVTGISLSHRSGHENVSVGPSVASSVPAATSRAPSSQIHAATINVKESAAGIKRCAVVNDPVTSAASADRRGTLRGGPTGVSAVWLPSMPSNGVCRSTVTSAPATTAATLVKAIETAKLSKGMLSCPEATIVPGRVELVFQYATGRPWAVVTVTLGSCAVATLPGGQQRLAGGVKLAALHEPGWVTGGLHIGASNSHASHQRGQTTG